MKPRFAPHFLLAVLLSLCGAAYARDFQNVRYGDRSPSQSVDIYAPDSPSPVPVVVFIHGGGWGSGDKSDILSKRNRHVEQALLKRGYAVASINYRLSSEARYPAAVEDVEAAIGFLRGHREDFGLDTRRIALWGESAGAHLAALAALRTKGAIRGVVDEYGPADLSKIPVQRRKLTGCGRIVEGIGDQRFLGLRYADPTYSAAARAASPIYAISGRPPAFLIIQGENDCMVPVEQSKEFAAALRHAGGDVELLLTPGPHGLWLNQGMVRKMVEFIDTHMTPAN